MLDEVHPDKVNFWVLKEYIRLIQDEAVFWYDAEVLARRHVADRHTISPQLLRKQNIWHGRRLLRAEQVRLMQVHKLRPRQAWRQAVENVAARIGVDSLEFTSVWKSYRWRKSQLSTFHWEGIMMVEGNQKRLARYQHWHAYPELFEAILKILYEYDILGVGGHARGGVEYCLEVEWILPELAAIRSEDDIWDIVSKVFVECCGDSTGGYGFSFDGIAEAIWELLGKSDSPLEEW